MIDNLKRLNDLDMVLARMDEEQLNNLYMRVFSSSDGELLLQDLANRLNEYIPTSTPFEEGMRSAYVSIVSRLRSAVAVKKEE